jgi:solute carrier family 25 folate transporter 32
MALPPATSAQGSGARVQSSTTTPLTRLAPYKYALASQIASAISTTAFYPFDVIKMRFMSHDGTPQRIHNGTQYTHVWRSIALVLREEGVRQLFRGAHVAVTGAVVAWGVYMLLYKELQRIAATLQQQQQELVEKGASSSASSSALLGGLLTTVGSSAVASAIANTLACPIFLIKARMQLEEQQKGAASRGTGAAAAASAAAEQRTLHYTTFRQGFRHVTATTGVLSLWRGLSAQLLLGLPNCLNLPIYEYLSQLRRAMRPAELRDKPLDLLEVCARS